MTYEEAKKQKQLLNDRVDELSEVLKKFPTGLLGLIEESVRTSPEYIEANSQYKKAFKELQNFNVWFLKNFKKEYMKERSNKYKRV